MKSSPSKPVNPQTFDSNPTYSEEIVGRVFLALFPNNIDIAVFFIVGPKSSKIGRSGVEFLINFKEIVLHDYWFVFNIFGCFEEPLISTFLITVFLMC